MKQVYVMPLPEGVEEGSAMSSCYKTRKGIAALRALNEADPFYHEKVNALAMFTLSSRERLNLYINADKYLSEPLAATGWSAHAAYEGI
jgi:hypothetical protein